MLISNASQGDYCCHVMLKQKCNLQSNLTEESNEECHKMLDQYCWCLDSMIIMLCDDARGGCGEALVIRIGIIREQHRAVQLAVLCSDPTIVQLLWDCSGTRRAVQLVESCSSNDYFPLRHLLLASPPDFLPKKHCTAFLHLNA